jgi:hypothetical protein
MARDGQHARGGGLPSMVNDGQPAAAGGPTFGAGRASRVGKGACGCRGWGRPRPPKKSGGAARAPARRPKGGRVRRARRSIAPQRGRQRGAGRKARGVMGGRGGPQRDAKGEGCESQWSRTLLGWGAARRRAALQGVATARRARARVEWQAVHEARRAHRGRPGAHRERSTAPRSDAPRPLASTGRRQPLERGQAWQRMGECWGKRWHTHGGRAHKGVRPSHGPIARGGGGQRCCSLARPRRWAPEESLVPLSPAERGEGPKTPRESSASARGAAPALHRGRRQRGGKQTAG